MKCMAVSTCAAIAVTAGGICQMPERLPTRHGLVASEFAISRGDSSEYRQATVQPTISKNNAMRIAKGMTLRQIEAILGAARDESDGAIMIIYPPRVSLAEPASRDLYWVSNEVAVTVRLDLKTDRVSRVWQNPTQ
jgi:hypothetical protein